MSLPINRVPINVGRINLWSGPRNVSTALMYSFGQRPDTRVVDEPLYGHYLRVSGADHPGAAEVMAAMETDGDTVVREVILGTPTSDDAASEDAASEDAASENGRPVVFFKQMAHHLVDLDHGFLARTANVLLVRDPVEMLPSLVNQIPEPTLRDTGLAAQSRLLAELRELGQEPPVLEAREVLLDPRGVLGELCRRLGLPFYEEMLSWPAGPRPYDGVWAPHWYHAVHRSTGFEPYRPKREPFPERLQPLLEECRPHYAALAAAAIRAAPSPAS